MSRSDRTLTSIVRDRAAMQMPQDPLTQGKHPAKEQRLPVWLPIMLGALATLAVTQFILELFLLNLALK